MIYDMKSKLKLMNTDTNSAQEASSMAQDMFLYRHYLSKMKRVDGPAQADADGQTSMPVKNHHEGSYIGDFPPKDDYKKDIYM